MTKASFPNNPNGPKRPKKPNSRSAKKKDPFARPPHPLGYQFLSDERPVRATKFSSVLPSIIAKYGLGRRLSVERFQNAWREALQVVFDDSLVDDFDYADLEDEQIPSKLETYMKYARPVSFRSATLRVEIASNLLYQELQFYLGDILKEMRLRLPDENIEKIKLL
jgi:hypothetical protein